MDLIWAPNHLRQQKLIDSSRVGAYFWLPRYRHLQRKYAHIRLAPMARFKVSYIIIQNGCTTMIYYRPSTLSQRNCLGLTKNTNPVRPISVSYTKNFARNKILTFV